MYRIEAETKMATLSHTFSNPYSWMNIVFLFKFHRNLFTSVHLTICQYSYWLRHCMAWRRTGNTPLSKPMQAQFMDAYISHSASMRYTLQQRINWLRSGDMYMRRELTEGHHWFVWCLVACSVLRHYPKQCWVTNISWTGRDKYQWNYHHNATHFLQ